MHIQCRTCNAQILAEDIDLPQRLAKCRKCHAVFSIASILAAEGIGLEPAPRPKPLQPKPPPHLVVEEWGSDLSLWYRWCDWGVLPMLLFCIVWDGFLVFWYSMALGGGGKGGFEWFALLFPLLHVAAGVAITYGALCYLLNITWIQLSYETLTIRIGPIPTGGNHTLRTKEIDQLFISYGNGWRQNGQQSYALAAVMKDGSRIELLSSTQPDLLLWLEHKLEEKLKIQDRAVPGEVEW